MTDSFSYPPPANQYDAPPNTLVLTAILLVFFFFGFFSVYFCRCFMENVVHSWNFGQNPSANAADGAIKTGLDPSLIRSFPTFPYSRIKEFRSEKYDLECAICLVEFEDQSVLRILAVCYHVFHKDCIDLWLESHVTCPVCRRNLEKSAGKTHDWLGIITGTHCTDETIENIDDQVSIYIKEDDDEEQRLDADRLELHGRHKNGETQRFWRSNSTGHSIIKRKEEEERHNWRTSCTTFAEFSRHPNNNPGFTEVSGREPSYKQDILNLEP